MCCFKHLLRAHFHIEDACLPQHEKPRQINYLSKDDRLGIISICGVCRMGCNQWKSEFGVSKPPKCWDSKCEPLMHRLRAFKSSSAEILLWQGTYNLLPELVPLKESYGDQGSESCPVPLC